MQSNSDDLDFPPPSSSSSDSENDADEKLDEELANVPLSVPRVKRKLELTSKTRSAKAKQLKTTVQKKFNSEDGNGGNILIVLHV